VSSLSKCTTLHPNSILYYGLSSEHSKEFMHTYHQPLTHMAILRVKVNRLNGMV